MGKLVHRMAGRDRRAALPGLFAVVLVAVTGLGVPFPPSSRGAQQPPSQAKPATPAPEQTGNSPRAAGSPPESTSFRVRVQVVNVPITVLDKQGRPVIDLNKEDFRILEDGVPQKIRYFNIEPKPPLRIGLVLDSSNSARRQLNFEKDAASEFVFNMLQGRSSQNQIFLQTFDATSSFVQDFTNDPEILNERIGGLKAGGGKAFFDAIYSACRDRMLRAGPAENTRRVLVLLSDGIDIQSQHSIEEAISMAHRAETVIYAIGNAAYGYSNLGDKDLEKIASATGGQAFFPLRQSPGADLATGYLSHGQIGDTSQNKGLGASTGIYSAERLIHLADSLDSIGRELDDQYNIGYTPLNDKLDGTYRKIRVVALRKGVQVRAKPGYFAAP